MPSVSVNGQSLHYADTGGDGPPVLLSHPMFLDAVHMTPLADVLAAGGYRVVVFDQRCHGETRFDGRPFALVECAKDALGLASALGIGPAIFAGELLSATIALHAALLEPDRVAGLLLIGSTAYGTDPGEIASLGVGLAQWKEFGPQASEFARIAQAATGSAQAAADLMDRWRSADWQQVQLMADAWLGRPSIAENLGQVRCPAVVIHGSSEFYIPLEHGRHVYENLGGAKHFETIERQFQALSIVQDPKTLDVVSGLMRELFPVSNPTA
ncbi:alpha/beta fold hydrolase [Mycobacteroides franklinii]|uniref:alpha/beta fold hydrolase n=1 Tax=Mycobacteroides franklinii TaxID=948102 RepID=UPI0009944EA4|nr:alpha/beta hydrolase [Mycobacteroides franklinii]